jgi:hypothetical protein
VLRAHCGQTPGPVSYVCFQKRSNTIQAIEPIRQDVELVTRDEFVHHREEEVPLVLKGSSSADNLAATPLPKWFDFRSGDTEWRTFARPYLNDFSHTPVTYEWTLTPAVEPFLSSLQPGDLQFHLLSLISDNAASEHFTPFIRFTAPLALFIAALHYNNSQPLQAQKLTSLYIAQSSISSLPQTLQDDLSPPAAISTGSVYNSSIWLGLTPTYTPLHRDPNPNLFRQLYGSKVVRVLPPRAGEAVFRKTQSSIGGSASSRLRGHEMMHGPEKTALHDAIWAPSGNSGGGRTIYEARLGTGDALYLPEGWWHSIKSAATVDLEPRVSHDGQLNVSVNWWFRSADGLR